LSARERADLTVRSRERLHRYGWLFAGFAVLGAAVMLGFVLKLASDLPPGRDPTRLWVIGSLLTLVVVAPLGGVFVLMRRRARNPELLLGAGRSTKAAVRRALREGHTTDPRIDALAREAARHQLHLLRGRRRFLPWVFFVSALLYLASLVLNFLDDGFRWTMLPSVLGIVGMALLGSRFVVYVPRCRRYLTTTPVEAGDGHDVVHPNRS
jgi:FtsH-binding integral membrane protein